MRKLNRLLLILLLVCGFFYESKSQEYFQQDVKYKIQVRLNDSLHELDGEIEIEYTNNSKENLDFIYFHLWPNAYKNRNTALGQQMEEAGNLKLHFSKPEQRGFIDSLNFKVNGKSVSMIFDSLHIDLCKIMLASPLKPNGTVKISTPFHVKIPEGIFSRLGHMGQAYQISQWYPKPSVYDKNGWHPMPYLNQGEFYSEFGTYDVTIQVPANYVLGATGDLVNGEKEIAWLNEKVERTKEMFEGNLGNDSMAFPPSDSIFKTLTFHQERVHDFAWFADKRYHVLKGEVELPVSKRKVTTWSMFTNAEKNLWKKSIEYINDAVYYYSLWTGEYPYNHATAVDGALSAGGGMEYPNITVIGTSNTAEQLDVVIAHEVGHNWFYGILGTNERDYPWMDEGINSFYENRLMSQKYPIDKSTSTRNARLSKLTGLESVNTRNILELIYRMSARRRLDQAIDLHSTEFSELNYGVIVYEKTAMIFHYLEDYLGTEMFDKCMHRYFDEWKFKHPQANDLRKIFEQVSGQDLKWFFEDLIQTEGRVDYKILSAKKGPCEEGKPEECLLLNVKNVGDIHSPFSVSTYDKEGIASRMWFAGFDGKKEIVLPLIEYDYIQIDTKNTMLDINKKNNTISAHGLLKKMEPLRFKFLTGVENSKHTQVFFAPISGWNYYDGFMPGLIFYNSLLPQKRFEYVLVPMYGTRSEKFTLIANAGYNWYPCDGAVQRVKLGLSYRKFSEESFPILLGYQKLTPELSFTFKKPSARSATSREIILRSVQISKENARYAPTSDSYYPVLDSYYVNEIRYELKNKRKLNPYSLKLSLQQGEDFAKAGLELRYAVSFEKSRGLEMRFFSGKFLQNKKGTQYGFSFSGDNDYLYDAVYLGRNEISSAISQQFNMNEGGFKNEYPMLRGTDWMTALNLKLTPFGKFPLCLYADAGFSESSTTLEYDAGLAIIAIPDFFEVYFPFAMAKDLRNNNYAEKVRFVLNLNLIDPFKLVREGIQ